MVAYQVGDPMTEDGLKKAKACVESQLPWEFQVVHTSYGERTVHTSIVKRETNTTLEYNSTNQTQIVINNRIISNCAVKTPIFLNKLTFKLLQSICCIKKN